MAGDDDKNASAAAAPQKSHSSSSSATAAAAAPVLISPKVLSDMTAKLEEAKARFAIPSGASAPATTVQPTTPVAAAEATTTAIEHSSATHPSIVSPSTLQRIVPVSPSKMLGGREASHRRAKEDQLHRERIVDASKRKMENTKGKEQALEELRRREEQLQAVMARRGSPRSASSAASPSQGEHGTTASIHYPGAGSASSAASHQPTPPTTLSKPPRMSAPVTDGPLSKAQSTHTAPPGKPMVVLDASTIKQEPRPIFSGGVSNTSRPLGGKPDVVLNYDDDPSPEPSAPGSELTSPALQEDDLVLQNTWHILYDRRGYMQPARLQESNYENSLLTLCTFSTVATFWASFHYLKLPSQMEQNATYHVFKQGIKPMWEDPANEAGGRWIINFSPMTSPALIDDCWTNTLLSLIGQVLEESNEVTGAVFSKRQRGDRIAIWTRSHVPSLALLHVGARAVRALNLENERTMQMEFTYHKKPGERIAQGHGAGVVPSGPQVRLTMENVMSALSKGEVRPFDTLDVGSGA